MDLTHAHFITHSYACVSEWYGCTITFSHYSIFMDSGNLIFITTDTVQYMVCEQMVGYVVALGSY